VLLLKGAGIEKKWEGMGGSKHCEGTRKDQFLLTEGFKGGIGKVPNSTFE